MEIGALSDIWLIYRWCVLVNLLILVRLEHKTHPLFTLRTALTAFSPFYAV